jgi:CrcB protein
MNYQFVLLIALGGGIGAAARHVVSTLVQQATGAQLFPWGILVVNLTGCLLIGVLAQLFESTTWLSPATRTLLITGVLGGYTTYSTFALQSWEMAAQGLNWMAIAYVTMHVLLGLLAVGLGRMLVARFAA